MAAASARILLLEDDRTLRTGLVDALVGEGFEVVVAPDGFEGERQVRAFLARTVAFDLLIFDVMVPGPGGLELLRQVREGGSDVPVLVLTARGDENDKVLGFELGADDYVTKPFGLRELLARVKARLRRAPAADASDGTSPQFELGDVKVDLSAFELERDGERIPLSKTEAGLLQVLRDRPGEAVSRAVFLNLVWGSDQSVSNRTIDTHVLNLRQKVERDPKKPRHLLTVHGVGYRLQL